MFPYLNLIKWTDVTSETEYKEKYLKDVRQPPHHYEQVPGN
jgi:hypothetical protein